MNYRVISTFFISDINATDVAIDAPKKGIPNYKIAIDDQGRVYEILHPTFIRTHGPAKATFLIKGHFIGESINLNF